MKNPAFTHPQRPREKISRAFQRFINVQPSTLLTILGFGDLTPTSIFAK